LTSLIRRDDKPNELSQALGDVFINRIGPILADTSDDDNDDDVVVDPAPESPGEPL
jgi:hypothetical protein